MKVRILYLILAWPVVCCLAIRIIWGFDGLFSQDSFAYFQYAQSLTEAWSSGFQGEAFHWPVIYPFLGAFGMLLGLPETLWMQAVSAFGLVFTLYFTFKILESEFPEYSNRILVFLFLGLALSPYLLRASLMIMSDILALALVMAAIRFWQQFRIHKTAIWIPAFLGSSALAVLCRYPAAVVLFPFGMHLVYLLFKERKSNSSFGLMFFSALAGLMIFGAFSFWMIDQFSLAEGLQNHQGIQQWSIKHAFQREFVTPDGVSDYPFINLIYGLYPFFHPGFFPLGLLLLAFGFWKRPAIKAEPLFIISIALYFLFIIGFPIQNARFFFLTFPLILCLAYPIFHSLMDQFKIKLWIWILAFSLIQLALIARAMKPVFQQYRLGMELAEMVCDQAEPKVLTFYVDGAVQVYCPEKTVQNLIYPLDIEGSYPLVLFFPEAFESQWSETALFENWEYLQDQFELKAIEEHTSGWTLYQTRAKAIE